MARRKSGFGVSKILLILGVVAGGIWLLPMVLKGSTVVPPSTPQGTKAHTIIDKGVTVHVPADPNNVLMEHPTQGRAWIPNSQVVNYLPPKGEWKIV